MVLSISTVGTAAASAIATTAAANHDHVDDTPHEPAESVGDITSKKKN
jgi:hypothetical protein